MGKKPKRKDKKKIEAFLVEYRALSVRHGLDFKIELSVTAQAIVPVMVVIKLKKGNKDR